MKSVAAVIVVAAAALLAGCATPPPMMPPAGDLLRDDLFAPPTTAIDPDQALALSPAMRAYLDTRLRHSTFGADRRRLLVDALYRKDQLQLEYDANTTRTAAEAFEARSGNCLALVMMTGAFAKAMGLTVRYQVVLGEESFDLAGDLAISIGHVNLSLDDRMSRFGLATTDRDPWVIDFAPTADNRLQRTRPIQEHTLIAMFANNRAVESLVQGREDDAYWWVGEAIRRDPELMSAYLTLGVVYRQHRQPALAEAALVRVSMREPANTQALANRILALRDLGRETEASALQQQLDRLDPHPRFADFRLGVAAVRERRFDDARRLFEREIDRSPDYHEFHFWLAIAHAGLNDPKRAADELARAMKASTTRRDHDLYAAKLARLKALQLH